MKRSSIWLGICCVIILWLILGFGISYNPILNAMNMWRYTLNTLLYKKQLINCRPWKKRLNYKSDANVVFFYSHNYETLPEFAVLSQQITDVYCQRHNYSWLNCQHPSDSSVSPYWLRVQDLIRLSSEYPIDTIFIYLDLDACINLAQLDRGVDQFIEDLDTTNDFDIYIGKDTAVSQFINTGVMIVRNTEWSQQLLDEWWQQYDPNDWMRIDNKWKCYKGTKPCEWARDGYEQGALEAIYRNNWKNSLAHIAILHMDLLSNNLRVSKNTFIYHLMGSMESRRHQFFSNQVDKYI